MRLHRLIVPTIATVMFAACSQEPPPSVPLPLVKTLVAGESSAAATHSYSGEVRARYETLLGFRVGGKIAARLVDLGAVVKAGQALARLDGNDAALQVVQAEAQRQLAEAEAKRYRDLKEKNFISQSALDSKETTYKAAAAQASLARNQSAYTTLTADGAGVISAVLAEAGQVVAAGQGVVRLAHHGEREVAVNIPEDALAGLKAGSPAEVTLWAEGGKTFKGRVRELSPAADPATRTYPARVSLLGVSDQLPLGLSATVRFVDGGGATMSVPLGAIFQQGSQPAVWIVDKDNALALRPVTISRYGDSEATVSAGLAQGERIVAAGVHKLHAGEKVRVMDAPAAPKATP